MTLTQARPLQASLSILQSVPSEARTEPEIRRCRVRCCERLNPAAVNVNCSGLTTGAPEIGGVGPC